MKRSFAIAALGLTALTPCGAFAQLAPADEEAASSEEIVVTARKRDEDIQTVPISVVAYTAESLAQRNISNFNDLGNATPGVNITSIAGGTVQQIFVRGLAPANTGNDLNIEANVGTFIDGIYQTSRNTLDMISVLDVGQVEISKGPQSALFGRSTFAGALSISTGRPSDELEGSLSVTAGVNKDFRAKGSINVPLGDALALRIGGGYLTYDGWGKNAADPSNNLGGTRKFALTGSLLIKPTPDLEARISGFITDSKTEMTPDYLLPITADNCGTKNAAGFFQNFCGTLQPQIISDITPTIPRTIAKTNQISLDVKWSRDGISFISTTGLTHARNRTHNDYDASSAGVLLGVCTLGAACFPAGAYTRLVRANAVTISVEKVKTFSQEFRVQSDNDRPFQWLVGANYFNQKIPVSAGGVGVDNAGLAANERFVQVNQFAAPVVPGVGGYDFTANPFMTSNASVSQLSSSYAVLSTQTFSIFGALGYKFGNLRVNAEGRWNSDKKKAQNFSIANATGAPGIYQAIIGTTVPAAGTFPVAGALFFNTFESFTPRFTIDYQATPDIMIYASAAKGVRSGGFNTNNAVSATGILASEVAFDEETNWTYEAGVKSQLFDKRLTLNAAYFRTDWKNAQVTSFTTNPTAANPVAIVTNAGNIKSQGFEVQADARLDMFGIGGSLTWSNPQFQAGAYDASSNTGRCITNAATPATATAAPGCPPMFILTTAGGAQRSVINLEGLRTQRSVKLQWNLHATADVPLSGDWKATARVDVNHTGASFNNLPNTISFGKRTLTNARIGFSNGNYGISFWANNLFNKAYVQNSINQPRMGIPVIFSVPEVYLGERRRMGVTASAKF